VIVQQRIIYLHFKELKTTSAFSSAFLPVAVRMTNRSAAPSVVLITYRTAGIGAESSPKN
jgi:hypothetical protein